MNQDIIEDRGQEDTEDVSQEETITRSGRISKRKCFEDYITYNVFADGYGCDGEVDSPSSVNETLSRSDKEKWEQAMKKEYQSLMDNEAWVLVERPADKKIGRNKWVFCIKKDVNGEKSYKAHLVAKGFFWN